MFQRSHFALFIIATAISSCGGKKAAPVTEQISNQYALAPFSDVNNKSTLNLDLLKTLPRVLDLKDNMTSVKDQDERGTCSFFSSIALVEAAIKKKMKVEVNLSEEYMNNAVKSGGISAHDEGSYPENNLNYVSKKKAGFLLERDWPYQPSWFGQKTPCAENTAADKKASEKCFAHNSPPESVLAKKIATDNFDFLYLKADTTNEIIEVLAEYKLPMTMTVPVNDRGWPNDGNVQFDEEMRAECIKTPSICGFHSIVITGYDLDKKIFFFKNSWSKAWGQQGYGTIPFDVVDRHVKQSSVLVELNEDIVLPADYQNDPIRFSDFAVTSTELADHTVEVKALGKFEDIGFHALSTTSTLIKRKPTTALNAIITDDNSEVIELNEKEQTKYDRKVVSKFHILWQDTEANNLVWSREAPEVITIAPELMQIPTVQSLEYADWPNLMIRTSVYVYTDDSKYKILKRVYHPLDY
ncbi:MAG: C1 family peptidase [Bacteriovorax sp.]|nr:C1 family peptidase [Bacteriovorax sp.]